MTSPFVQGRRGQRPQSENPSGLRLPAKTQIPPAQEHILDQEDGKSRYCQAVTQLSQAFALCAAHDEAKRIRDDVSFFQHVRAALVKSSPGGKSDEELDQAIRQLVSKAIAAPDEVVDIFAAAGLKKPDISILSDEFLAEVKALPHRNVAVEPLRKLLAGEIKTRSKKNVVQARSFAEMLKRTVLAYQNRAIATYEVIEALIKLAQEMREADHVITGYRDRATNLRTQLQRIIKRAGAEPWPKLFQNLRASRATELAAEFPAHIGAAWLGHSTLIAQKHYWQVTDADFQKAASTPPESALQKTLQFGSKQGESGRGEALHETQENAEKDGKSEMKRLPRLDSNQENLIQSQVVFH